MANDARVIQVRLSPDARLAAGAAGATRYLASTCGLDDESCVRLQSAVLAGCEESFDQMASSDSELEVKFTCAADRIEVEFSHSGDGGPAMGLDEVVGLHRTGGKGIAAHAADVLRGFDRVQYETIDGNAITRLTKYISRDVLR